MQGRNLGLFIRAVDFAAWKHRSQRRKDEEASPYINHPIALANLLANDGGVHDLDVLCAAVLHDTIEDTETSEAEIANLFGPRIAAIVAEVTDDKALPKEQRKQLQVDHAPHISRAAQLVKLADKICNLRDLLVAPPAGWDATRQAEHFLWAARVVDGLRGVHPGLEALFDATFAQRPRG
jgi:guanosine-3',5'-bis(diphosphate) 3'-pyrophosphohydrolase